MLSDFHFPASRLLFLTGFSPKSLPLPVDGKFESLAFVARNQKYSPGSIVIIVAVLYSHDANFDFRSTANLSTMIVAECLLKPRNRVAIWVHSYVTQISVISVMTSK